MKLMDDMELEERNDPPNKNYHTRKEDKEEAMEMKEKEEDTGEHDI